MDFYDEEKQLNFLKLYTEEEAQMKRYSQGETEEGLERRKWFREQRDSADALRGKIAVLAHLKPFSVLRRK